MDNQNSITYADDWKNADNFVYYSHEENETEPQVEKKEKKLSSKPLLILIQIGLCLLLTAAAYGLKSFGGDIYQNVRKAYYSALNDEIILSESFESFSIDKLFDSIKN